MAYTKEQMKAYHKEYYKKNREKILKANAEWKEANKEHHLAKCKEYRERTPEQQQAYSVANRKKARDKGQQDFKYRMKRHLASAKTRAKQKGLAFDLTVDDLDIPDVCPILGLPFELTGPRSKMSPSLDRIVPELGYTKDNVRIISDLANRMKQEATKEELEAFAANILKYVSVQDGRQ